MNTQRGSRAACRPLAAWMILAFLALAPALRALELKTVVERREVYQGESFLFQLQVLGASAVDQPDVPDLPDFDVREIPVNWIRTRVGSRLQQFDLENGTSYLYRLIALRPGSLAIPPFSVGADGTVLSSKATVVRVLEPPDSPDFKLSLTLAKRQVYIGEPVLMRAVWYYRLSAHYYAVNIPILRHPSFKENGSSGYSPSLRPMAANSAWEGVEGKTLLNGIPYDTVSFERVLIPSEAGSFDFPASTVQVWGAGEPESSSGRGRWDFDSIVVGSQPFRVLVRPVPLEGRPDNYSGLVADALRLRAEIQPAEMNVGDPVTLSLTLSGPAAIAQARLPPLESFAQLGEDFLLREDSLREQVGEKEKVFRVGLRVRSEEVRALPSLEIPYFNTRSGTYQTARSAAVPITVRPTRVLTESDLEGAGGPPAALAETAWTVRDWKDGILFNYADTSRLLSREAGVGELARRPAVVGLLVVPAAVLALAALLAARRRAARLAAAEGPALDQPASPPPPAPAGPGSAEEALAAFRELLKVRLGLPPGRLIWQDLQAELAGRGLEAEVLQRTRELFDLLERRRYAGAGRETAGEEQALAERAVRLTEELDARLGPAQE